MIPIGTQNGQLLLRPKEAAELLSISPRKLWSLTASGSIPYLRIGRLVRYSFDSLRDWIDEQSKGGES